jgi:hypothetical protein
VRTARRAAPRRHGNSVRGASGPVRKSSGRAAHEASDRLGERRGEGPLPAEGPRSALSTEAARQLGARRVGPACASHRAGRRTRPATGSRSAWPKDRRPRRGPRSGPTPTAGRTAVRGASDSGRELRAGRCTKPAPGSENAWPEGPPPAAGPRSAPSHEAARQLGARRVGPGARAIGPGGARSLRPARGAPGPRTAARGGDRGPGRRRQPAVRRRLCAVLSAGFLFRGLLGWRCSQASSLRPESASPARDGGSCGAGTRGHAVHGVVRESSPLA